MAAVNPAVQAALDTVRHRERWKYSKADTAIELVRAQETTSLTDHPSVGRSTLESAISEERLLAEHPELLVAYDKAQPIDVLELNSDAECSLVPSAHSRPLLIRCAPNVRISLRLDSEHSNGSISHIWLSIGTGAHVQFVRNLVSDAPQWHVLRASLARDSFLQLATHSLGSTFHRQDTTVLLEETGAELKLTGASVCPAASHLDTQLVVEHRAPNTRSDQIIHVIAREDAEATFGGRIHIHERCSGAEADLSNKNLVLSPSATINTKPELEIYTDDVKCSHGATIGRLDEDQAFYCAARSIDAVTARRMLSFAFLKSAMVGEDAILEQFAKSLT